MTRSCFDGHPHRPAAYPYCADCFGTLASLRDLAITNGHGARWIGGRVLDGLWGDEPDYRERMESARGLVYIMNIDGHGRVELSV